MKKCLLLSFLLFQTVYLPAQESSEQVLAGERVWRVPRLTMENGEIVYHANIPMEGAAKEALYTKAYYWLKNNLRSSDAAMRVHDKKEGIIAGKGEIRYNQNVVAANTGQAIYFDYDIRIDDGGYTYSLNNITATLGNKRIHYSDMYREELNKGDNAGQWTHKYRYEMLSDMHSFITLFLQGLKAEMAR